MSEKSKSIFDPKYRDFIAFMVERRKSINMTQRELAKRLGVVQCYVARIETHERRLDIIEAIDMMRALQMNERDIIKEIKKLI